MEMNSTLYPGAHLKYSFDLPGIAFKSFSCSVDNPEIKEVIFQKVEEDNPTNRKCWMILNIGPVSSLEEAEKIGNSLKEELLDRLSLLLGTKVGKAKLIGYGLIPKPGEGAQGHFRAPALQMRGASHTEDRRLSKEDIDKVRNSLVKTSLTENFLPKLFRYALQIEDELVRFMMFYLVLLSICEDNQVKVDDLILKIDPSTDYSVSPYNKRINETCYTRLRNEIAHYRSIKPEATQSEISERLCEFQRIVWMSIMEEMQ
jgi:hypothetical protein